MSVKFLAFCSGWQKMAQVRVDKLLHPMGLFHFATIRGLSGGIPCFSQWAAKTVQVRVNNLLTPF